MSFAERLMGLIGKAERWLKRLRKKEKLILHLLKERNGSTGLDLVKASYGVLHRGTVYIWLNRLHDRGYVQVNYCSDGLGTYHWILTRQGWEALAALNTEGDGNE